MSKNEEHKVSDETIERTISACAWLVDIAEAGSLNGTPDAAAAFRWLENLGSRVYLDSLSRQSNTSQISTNIH